MEEEKKSGNKAVVILLALLLLGSLAANFYLYKNRGEKEVVITEKEVVIDSLVEARVSVQKELEMTIAELNSYRGQNEELNKKIDEYVEKLKQREGRIQTLMKDKKGLQSMTASLKKELEEIKKERDSYLEDIERLRAENEQLRTDLQVVNQSRDSLQGQVNTASTLRVEYVKVNTFHLRNSGKQIQTGLARRTEKMDVCFSIMDNKVAAIGPRIVHMRIMQPDGKVLGEKGKFTVADKGIESGYTDMQEINYDRSKKDICMSFTDEKYDFQKGTYIIEIFIDGMLYTTGFYDLK